MNAHRSVAALLGLALLAATGCAERMRDPTAPSPKFAGTSFYESGTDLFIGVDLRAAWIGGPRNMLPVYLVMMKQEGPGFLDFGRESFVLEFPDKSRTALATFEDWDKNYRRSRPDAQVTTTYLETINGRFPQPPYEWQRMDFFPLRGSGIFPREDFEIRARQLWHGYLYFPLPDEAPAGGRYKLLATPNNADVTYVVDFPPFGDDKESQR